MCGEHSQQSKKEPRPPPLNGRVQPIRQRVRSVRRSVQQPQLQEDQLQQSRPEDQRQQQQTPQPPQESQEALKARIEAACERPRSPLPGGLPTSARPMHTGGANPDTMDPQPKEADDSWRKYRTRLQNRRDGLVEIAMRTVMLMRQNRQLQQKLAALQAETRVYVQSMMHVEGAPRHWREDQWLRQQVDWERQQRLLDERPHQRERLRQYQAPPPPPPIG